ncbi:hypothetical protein L5515_016888 [Caenorhabditis briggsae]|uniref:Uncharacterized protein n=2 Tax=Caenorhabditis briggsae TaxID=6238 RepID=A0AAE9FI51_CAEBR|nr:hypothetical protein L5515_016888 [Caenorhabditis briggsae]
MKDFFILVVATVCISHYMGPSDNFVVIRSSLVKDERMHTPPTPQNNSELEKKATVGVHPLTRKDTDPAHLGRAVTAPMEGGGKKETTAYTTTARPDTPPAHFQRVTASSRSMNGAGGYHIHSKPVSYCSKPPTEERTPGRLGNNLSTHPPRGSGKRSIK